MICTIQAQSNKAAIHLSNPLVLLAKAGLKVEYRTDKTGYLLMGKLYYGGLPRYPGEKVEAIVRNYWNLEGSRHENFFYGKLVAGHLQNYDGSGSGFTRIQNVPESNYYGVGVGVGRHYNFDRYFFEVIAGLKYVKPDVSQEAPFYISGPGSVIDLNFTVGIQF
jgi:hypothetical protein